MSRNLKPFEGQVKTECGLRFVYFNGCWLLDQFPTTIDRHHTYSGHQDEKKPYRGARKAHIIASTKLLR